MILLAMSLAGAARAAPLAEPVAPRGAAQVTVTAPKPPPAPSTPQETAEAFVTAHLAFARNGQVSRWNGPICVTTAGLTPGFDAFVTSRVTLSARALGLKIAPVGHCLANVEILFTSDPQAFMDLLVRRRPEFLGFHYASATKALTVITRPIQSWYVTGVKGLVGDPTPDLNDQISLADLSGNILQAGSQPAGCAGSRLTHCSSSVFLNVLILADTRLTAGRTIGSVADYVTLLALSRPRSLEACGPLPSILDLFSSGCTDRPVPTGLSRFDHDLLAALYATNPESEGALQKAAVADRLARDVAASLSPSP